MIIGRPPELLPASGTLTLDDPQHQAGETVAVPGYFLGDGPHALLVGMFQAPSQGINQHLLGQAFGESVGIGLQERPQFLVPLEGPAVGQRSRGFDGELAVFLAPAADGVKVFQGKA